MGHGQVASGGFAPREPQFCLANGFSHLLKLGLVKGQDFARGEHCDIGLRDLHREKRFLSIGLRRRRSPPLARPVDSRANGAASEDGLPNLKTSGSRRKVGLTKSEEAAEVRSSLPGLA